MKRNQISKSLMRMLISQGFTDHDMAEYFEQDIRDISITRMFWQLREFKGQANLMKEQEANKETARYNREETATIKHKKCLKCRETFIPAHRTNFICGTCARITKRETGLLYNYDYHLTM